MRPSPIDERFRKLFLRAYRGPLQPELALWWLEHPGESERDGAMSPAANVEQARQALFAPNPPTGALAHYEHVAELFREHERATAGAVEAARSAGGQSGHVPGPDPSPPRDGSALRPSGWRVLLLLLLGVITFLAGVAVGRGNQSGAGLQVTARSSRSQTVAALPSLANPHAPGSVILRMTNLSPRVGGSLPESGTTAFESPVIDVRSRRLRLSVVCTGGDSLVVVPGSGALVSENYVTVTCPTSQPGGVAVYLAAAATAVPFHLVVYERQPVAWKLVLTVDPS